MTDFVTIRESDWELFKQKLYKAQVKDPMESGKVYSRARHTTYKHLFTIGWKWLTLTDYNSLKTFWYTYLGSSFNWTHIWTDVVYVVRFSDDLFPEISFLGDSYVIGPEELNLEEV